MSNDAAPCCCSTPRQALFDVSQYQSRRHDRTAPRSCEFRNGSWPCKNTLPRASVRSRNGSVSGCDRNHQRVGPNDVHDSCQIIGQDRESHLGGYFWKRFGEEVCRPMRAFIVPNGCSTLSRRWRMASGFASAPSAMTMSRRSAGPKSSWTDTHWSYGKKRGRSRNSNHASKPDPQIFQGMRFHIALGVPQRIS